MQNELSKFQIPGIIIAHFPPVVYTSRFVCFCGLAIISAKIVYVA